MAHAELSQWQAYDILRKLVADAIKTDLEDRGLTEEEMDHVYFMVSPDYDEVFAWVNISKRDIDLLAFEGWTLEYAESFEQADEIVKLYFDLR